MNSWSVGTSCSTCGCVENSCASCTEPTACSNCATCCCSADHASWRLDRIHSGLRLEYLSSAWMGVEVVGSIGMGLISGSLALMAFGSDSLVELLSAFVVARHLRDDVGGSGTLGGRTAQFSSLLLLSLLPIIGIGAGYSYLIGVRPEGSIPGIAVAVAAVILMPYLWLQKRKIGDETNCLPLKIDSLESATCFFMSLALLGGLLAESLLGLWWADYLATGAILAFVAREAAASFNQARRAGTNLTSGLIRCLARP